MAFDWWILVTTKLESRKAQKVQKQRYLHVRERFSLRSIYSPFDVSSIFKRERVSIWCYKHVISLPTLFQVHRFFFSSFRVYWKTESFNPITALLMLNESEGNQFRPWMDIDVGLCIHRKRESRQMRHQFNAMGGERAEERLVNFINNESQNIS
jgi:hypothetical protein